MTCRPLALLSPNLAIAQYRMQVVKSHLLSSSPSNDQHQASASALDEAKVSMPSTPEFMTVRALAEVPRSDVQRELIRSFAQQNESQGDQAWPSLLSSWSGIGNVSCPMSPKLADVGLVRGFGSLKTTNYQSSTL